MRTFDAGAFQQAAGMMDQMEAARLARFHRTNGPSKLAGQAKDYLNRGLLLEAERLYQSAVRPMVPWPMRMPVWPQCGSAPATPARHAKKRSDRWN